MKTIITIGRQYGSAGHSIGKILADDLGIKYYDWREQQRTADYARNCSKTTMKNQPTAFYTLWLWTVTPSAMDLP